MEPDIFERRLNIIGNWIQDAERHVQAGGSLDKKITQTALGLLGGLVWRAKNPELLQANLSRLRDMTAFLESSATQLEQGSGEQPLTEHASVLVAVLEKWSKTKPSLFGDRHYGDPRLIEFAGASDADCLFLVDRIAEARATALAECEQDPQAGLYSADAWIERGEVDLAAQLEVRAIEKRPPDAARIKLSIDRWLDKGYPDHAVAVARAAGRSDPEQALQLFRGLVRAGRYEVAARLANDLLLDWVGGVAGGEVSQEMALDRVYLAMTSGNREAFNRLLPQYKERLAGKEPSENVTAFEERFSFVCVGPQVEAGSVADCLLSRMYVNMSVPIKYGITKDEFCAVIADLLCSLAGRHPDLGGLFHAMAVYARENPFMRVDLCDDSQVKQEGIDYEGGYSHNYDTCEIRTFFGNRNGLAGTLSHEWTHQLMNVLFKNGCRPYLEGAGADFAKVTAELRERLESAPQPGSKQTSREFERARRVLGCVPDQYAQDKHDNEYIVRYIECLAKDLHKDPAVAELLTPLARYWKDVVAPRIEAFVQGRQAAVAFLEMTPPKNPKSLDPVLGLLYEVKEHGSAIGPFLCLYGEECLTQQQIRGLVETVATVEGNRTTPIMMLGSALEKRDLEAARFYMTVAIERVPNSAGIVEQECRQHSPADLLAEVLAELGRVKRAALGSRIKGTFWQLFGKH